MESHESRRLAADILLKCRRVPSTSAVWGRGKVLLGLGVMDPRGGRGNGHRDERSCGQGDGTGNGQVSFCGSLGVTVGCVHGALHSLDATTCMPLLLQIEREIVGQLVRSASLPRRVVN